MSARVSVCVRLRFEGPAGGVGRGVGGSVGGGRLDRLVGHDPGGKLLLGFLEAGSCGAVESVHLDRAERGDSQSAEPPSPFLAAIRFRSVSINSLLLTSVLLFSCIFSLGHKSKQCRRAWASLALTYLFEHDEGAHGQSGEEGCDQQHDDAHRDAGVETDEGQDPATGGGGKNSKPNSHCESVSLHNGTCKDGAGKKRHKKEPPCSPAGDADGLQDVNAELADVDEEKDEEAE